MRVFFIRKVAVIIFLFLLVLAVMIGIPAAMVSKTVSPESREYWEGSTDIVWHVDTREKVIALTFDDGPSTTFTPMILDILKKNNAKATFFVIARRAEIYQDIVHRIVYEGHEIASHTYNHRYLNRITENELREELSLADITIRQVAGVKPKLFRPPGGYYNEKIVRVSKEFGYKVVIWSWEQQPKDWANPGTQTIIRRVLKDAASGNIVVFHDQGGNRTQTVQALQPIINDLKSKGYKFITVSEMIAGSKH